MHGDFRVMLKRLSKAMLQHPVAVLVMGFVGSLYLRCLWWSIRWTFHGRGHPEALIQAQQPFILCFWHGRLMMMPFSWRWSRPVPMRMLISSHRDGRLISSVVRFFGISTIAGSSSRDAVAAFRALLTLLKKGDCVGITPDGPRGPALSIKEGILKAAYLAQVPIVPVTFSTDRGKTLGSWDRFLLAKPFGRGVFVWGAPLYPPPRGEPLDVERFRDQLQQAMAAVTQQADAAMGRVTP